MVLRALSDTDRVFKDPDDPSDDAARCKRLKQIGQVLRSVRSFLFAGMPKAPPTPAHDDGRYGWARESVEAMRSRWVNRLPSGAGRL
jgi:hypothetical protein